MHPLQVIMIMSSTAMLLITALLLIIRKMPSREGINCWLFASFIQAVIYVIAYISYPAAMDVSSLTGFFFLQTLVTLAMNIGTLKFIKVPMNRKIRFAVVSTSLFFTIVCTIGGSFTLGVVIFALTNSILMFEVAYRLYMSKYESVAIKISTILFGLIGLHWLDYPLLSRVEWFVPIGFMIGMMLVVAAFLTLAILALLQFKLQTEESEQRAIQAAIHDPLTGLYNRSHLDDLFNDYAEEAEQIQRPFILLYFDLDGFKFVNDTYGHPAGDLILTTVSKRMSKWLGAKGDAIRVGGDELIVLTRLRADFSRENSMSASQRILNLIEQPIVDGAHTYKVSASVGGCCYGLPHCDLENMINEADKLMYEAKQSGGHCIRFSQIESDNLIAQSKQKHDAKTKA